MIHPGFHARNRSIVFLVALVISFGQLNIIVHNFNIDDSHPDHCVICTQIEVQGHGIAPAPLLLASVLLNDFPVAARCAGNLSAFPHIPPARAPPVILA
jgi:hypothetical protein